jgi:hypothetical protein
LGYIFLEKAAAAMDDFDRTDLIDEVAAQGFMGSDLITICVSG